MNGWPAHPLLASVRTVPVRRVEAALPQTQCTRCGYPDCAAYARAIVQDGAAINRCPPGGQEGVRRLSAVTGLPVVPLDTACGAEGARGLAVIDEDWCIGCTLCIAACPVDAIVGLNKRMHVVIAQHCTGCELCVPACPVDCIHMDNTSGTATGWQAWSEPLAERALARYRARGQRLHPPDGSAEAAPLPPDKARTLEAVLARARAQRGAGQ